MPQNCTFNRVYLCYVAPGSMNEFPAEGTIDKFDSLWTCPFSGAKIGFYLDPPPGVSVTVGSASSGGGCGALVTGSVIVKVAASVPPSIGYVTDFVFDPVYDACYTPTGQCIPTNSIGSRFGIIVTKPTPAPSPSPSAAPTPDPLPSGCGGGGTSGRIRSPLTRSSTDAQPSLRPPFPSGRRPAAICPGPSPSPTPTPAPELIMAFDAQAGNVVSDAAGAEQIAREDTAQVDESATVATAVASTTRRPESTELAVAGAPRGYVDWPHNLPQSSFVSRLGASLLLTRVTLPYCYAAISENQADPAQPDNPRNQMLYQVQTFCYNDATVATIDSTWQGRGYNGTEDAKVITVASSCTDRGPDPWSLGIGRACFTPVTTVPLAWGHAELNEWVSLQLHVAYRGKTYAYPPLFRQPYNVAEQHLNNKAVPYPVVPVDPSWGPNRTLAGHVPFPAPPFRYCGPGTSYTPIPGCFNFPRNSFTLATALATGNVPFPRPADTAANARFEAHHIKPVSWAGDNCATNGVWLPTAPKHVHSSFSTWWALSNFKPDGSSVVAVPAC